MTYRANSYYIGDCREVMRGLLAAGLRVQCVVTSPPYWGLRDYGVEGQLGLERTYPEYIANMVEVFELVRQLLAGDGTLWLNIGDSYAGSWGAQGRQGMTGEMAQRSIVSARQIAAGQRRASGTGSIDRAPGCKPKDLVGIPWRLAFALQDAGWWLRQDIIWHKPNPMPESVTDRCTKAHEHLFLMAKSERYYYDADAIKEPAAFPEGPGNTTHKHATAHEAGDDLMRTKAGLVDIGARPFRNKRSVWTVATQPYREAHFATFPEALVEPCILAGTRPGDIVFDPFLGSGTVAAVAQRLGRRWLGAELNPAYGELIDERTRGPRGMELTV
jgi:DNA modification methylase